MHVVWEIENLLEDFRGNIVFNKMNKAYTLKIGAKSYQLNFIDSKKMDSLLESLGVNKELILNKVGVTDYYLQQIFIRSDVHPDLISECVLHELLHAMLDDAGINSIPVIQGVDLSETVVTITSPRLLAALRDNETTLKLLHVL